MSRIRWQFTEGEISIIKTKHKKSQLYFALQLKHYANSMSFIEDKRAITPLLHEHINPYGVFVLDLNSRLAIKHPSLKEAA